MFHLIRADRPGRHGAGNRYRAALYPAFTYRGALMQAVWGRKPPYSVAIPTRTDAEAAWAVTRGNYLGNRWKHRQ